MGPSQMVWISGSMTDFFGGISTFFVDFSPFHYFIGQIIISFAGFNPLPTPSCYCRVWSIAYLLVLLIIPHLLVMSPCLLLLSWCTTNLYQWSLDSCLPKSLIPFLLVWFITFISHYCFYHLSVVILYHTSPYFTKKQQKTSLYLWLAAGSEKMSANFQPHHCWDEHPVVYERSIVNQSLGLSHERNRATIKCPINNRAITFHSDDYTTNHSLNKCSLT